MGTCAVHFLVVKPNLPTGAFYIKRTAFIVLNVPIQPKSNGLCGGDRDGVP